MTFLPPRQLPNTEWTRNEYMCNELTYDFLFLCIYAPPLEPYNGSTLYDMFHKHEK